MKNKKLTLRLKLTLFTSALFLTICLLQAVISIYSSGMLASAVTSPPLPLEPSLPMDYSGAAMTVPVEAAQQSFNQIAVVAMLLLASIGCGIIYFIVKKELKPLESLTQQVSNLDVGNGLLPLQMPVVGDEIKQVAAAVDDMAFRVSDAYLMQKNFSANVAHELRTPLTVIQNKLEVFRLKKDRTPKEHEALNEVLYQNVGRLSSLVDELLQLTNQNKVDMTTPVSLSPLVKETVMELETLAKVRNISIKVIGDATLLGNDCLLQRLVFNLVQNAIKYNVENGAVEVSMKDSEDTVQLWVSDTGVGIPENAKPHIFEPFFRVDKSRSREMGGSGLGLALVKHIVDRHSGSIFVKDNTPQGTIFQMTFPKDIGLKK